MKLQVPFSVLSLLGISSAFSPNSIRSLSTLSHQQHQQPHTLLHAFKSAKKDEPLPQTTDVIVIGSGLAGLSCASLLSHNEISTLVLESHDTIGGAAHSWERRGFHFESGPSLYSGFSIDKSPNPLKNIFQIIGEEPEWITYDRWGTVLPNGKKFAAKIGPEEFGDVLDEHGGPGAREEFEALMKRMGPLSDAAQALTSMALREDAGAIVTLLRYPRELFDTLKQGQALNDPFAYIMDEMEIKNDFVKNWLDMLCFLLQGLPAAGTMNAVMAYMLADWYRPGVTLDFPKGGSGAIADALAKGVEKWKKSRVCVNSHVDEIIVENGKASGVKLSDGTIIKATKAVVSNADPFVTKKLLQNSIEGDKVSTEFKEYMEKMTNTNDAKDGIPNLKSFIHIHAGIDATGLPPVPSADFPAQWAVVRDWEAEEGVESPRNIVLCSMPSLIDPTLAPEGKHVLHAYVPATEPYEWWAGMDRNSEEYKKKKDEAADFLWSAIEEYVPNARERAVPGTVQIATPLTHERFLRRTNGAYGPRVEAGKHTLPGHTTPLDGLLLCGDFTFPGIGVPATAASGAIAANNLVSVGQHWKMLDKIRLPDRK
ncbi:carotenoid isomerase [Chaetoceros tenuissimus]|uniref:Amine oxidase n=1 Tax=Chaetoceros tenuissimus TaxID=426638 RepID=A0AAD3CGN8_9STRA|nr:carotenoid isomerase [Chaetoceros tenuissimus]